ncbi:MAG: hypothetical protein CME26_10400 [Gemmatimonadetes bacterium]|nr:hypothetical protein [Gemmatimonadota bacterium]
MGAGQSFGRFSREAIDRMLFVGITRARNWIYMSTENSLEVLISDRVTRLKKAGLLTVQSGDAPLFDGPGGSEKGDDDDDILDVV